MKISYNWLQTHIEEKLPAPQVIEETFIFHAFEVESVEKKTISGVDDTLFDIKVLPDRAADCSSQFGVARELAGLLSLTLKKDTSENKSYREKYTKKTDAVEIKTDLCRAYTAVKISGVTSGDSGEALKNKLVAIDQPSVNSIVDCANIVMFDTGQPIHIFDADNVDGPITVRLTHEKEKIRILGDEEKILPENTIVVTDTLGTIAIAGIKGGKSAAITTETKNIIIEIANFDAVSVRRSARKLALLTESARRFENSVPVEYVSLATAHIIDMILETVGGTVEWIQEILPEPTEPQTLSFTVADIADKLGTVVTTETISSLFTSYGYTFTNDNDIFVLTVPYWRPDITEVSNIVEEVGRVIGYDTIEPVPFSLSVTSESNKTFSNIQAVKSHLVSQGFIEVQTYTFVKKGEVEVYGAKDKSALRTNLSEGLKESYELNTRNAPLVANGKNPESIKLFEVGTVFFADREETHVATVDAGVFQESTLDAFVTAHPNISEVSDTKALGAVSPFKQWSLYPFILRDIAVWVSTESAKEQLQKIVHDFALKHCVRDAVLFDTFYKDRRTSIAYRFVFQSYDKTLTDKEVETVFSELIENCTQIAGLEVR